MSEIKSWDELCARFGDEWKARIDASKSGGPAVANIQWKGTDVCMDILCPCGMSGHVDGYFAHHVRCGACGRVWACNTKVELVACAPEHDPDGCCLDFGEDDEDE